MTLQEAINSGKRFARSADASIGDYISAEDFLENGISLEDYNANDYELEPEMSQALSVDILERAWNDTKPASVLTADRSEFYSRFKAKLVSLGVALS